MQDDGLPDVLVTDEDVAVTGNVLANDNFDDPAASVTAVTAPTHGSVTFLPDGTVTYTPDADFHGTDAFTYTVTNSDSSTDTEIVSVTVNPVDDASPDSIVTGEDVAATVNVLANDSFEDPAASVIAVTDPPRGSVTFLPDGTVRGVLKHLEMGQGPTTGLATLVAEELDADWERVDVEFAPADNARCKNLAFDDIEIDTIERLKAAVVGFRQRLDTDYRGHRGILHRASGNNTPI